MMTLTEAYEELLKLHEQRESILDRNEYCIKGDGTDCCILTENSGPTGFSTVLMGLSECLYGLNDKY